MASIRGRRVLIVEDEPLLAEDLSRYFRKMGAIVLGPASNLDAAVRYVDLAEAAVLDVNLNGRKVFPVADALMRRHVPFVFFTGAGDVSIPLRFQLVGRLYKPVNTDGLFDALFPPEAGRKPMDSTSDDAFAVLPKLRLTALLLLEDASSADRLVELTLERALGAVDTRSSYASLEDWLSHVLEQTHRTMGRNLMS
ncbi:response regulator [Roseibium salinum]|uniref:Response regulator n=1 Tax=Roseibium salinum TaxID=1604349 RepID=A0ABT3QWS3_9HYPH|nr:response regulator [Roseibium sp. DSM 29163]MCX2721377.1 response regulator [Roseibium sp. DSM 29163]MDN3721860.1 response regulator [Roseibium salinum]